MSGIKAQWAKSLRDQANGKIGFPRMGYTFSPDGYTNPNGVFFKASMSDDGRMVSLGAPRAIPCPSKEHGGEYPLVRGVYWVPQSKCTKCPMRLKGRHCLLLRRSAAEVYTGAKKILDSAMDEAQEALKT